MADQNGTGSGGQGYRYSSGGSNRNNRNSSWGEWIAIAVLFCIPSGFTQVVAVVWALSKVFKMSKGQKQQMKNDVRQAADRVRQDAQKAAERVRQEVRKDSSGQSRQTAAGQKERTTAGQDPWESGFQYTYAAESKKKAKAKKTKIKGGNGLLVTGIIFAAIFGLVAFITGVSLVHPAIPLSFFAVTMVFIGMIIGGVGKNRARDRYLNYLAYIGNNRAVSLPLMAASFDVSIQKLCKDLRNMLSKGILPTGYLDLAEGKLYLTEEGYHAPEPKAEPQPEPMSEEQEDDILRQIRKVNDDIPDEVMSAKIDRIEEITGKILAYQKARPEKAGQLRSFLNYYLPTTLKILRAYAQLDAQGIEGENISAAKARIEGMMDQVVSGFEKQLDKLFQDDAMDINSDVQVLENMLKKDGLSGNDGMTMTM